MGRADEAAAAGAAAAVPSETWRVAEEVRPVPSTRSETRTYRTHRDSGSPISWIGNLLWIWLAGGAVVAAVYFIFGALLVCTVVLAPFGLQLIKLGELALFPFGKRIETCVSDNGCESLLYVALNVLWAPIGVVLVLWHIAMGVVCACTCYGIIFSFQHIKLARMAFCPFGSRGPYRGEITETLVTTYTTDYNYQTVPSAQAIAASSSY